MRFLIAVCVGVAATLAWQSYGDAARQIAANSYPQLSWLAPADAAAQTAPAAIAPAIATLDQQELKMMSRDLAALRQRVDQLAAGQERMARAQQEMLGNISAPAPQPVAAPARKPVAPPAQAAPVR
jgi:hypothetical protein